jgi:hypothetical protein
VFICEIFSQYDSGKQCGPLASCLLECFFWQDLSVGTNRFDLVTLTLVFDLYNENFNHVYIFWIICTRTYNMSVCCNKSFQWVPTGLTLCPWPLFLTYFLKTFNLTVSFHSLDWYGHVLELWYCTWVFLETRLFHGYQQL